MTKHANVCTKMYGDIQVTSYGNPDTKLAVKLLAPIVQKMWLQKNGLEKSEIDSFLKNQAIQTSI
jgi:3-oxoacyl-[acyl-carrier-protein] synthase III